MLDDFGYITEEGTSGFDFSAKPYKITLFAKKLQFLDQGFFFALPILAFAAIFAGLGLVSDADYGAAALILLASADRWLALPILLPLPLL